MVAIHMDRPVGPQTAFRVARVISKATNIYVRNFALLFLIFLVFILAAQGGNYLLRPYMPQPGQTVVPPAQVILSGAVGVGYLLVYMLAVAVAIQGVFQYLRDGRAQFGPSFAAGLARAPAMIGVGFLSMVVVMLVAGIIGGLLAGIVFAVWQSDAQAISLGQMPSDPAAFVRLAGVILAAALPALFLLVIWHVSTAACVAEELGPIRSLGRSRKLTKGFRWRMLMLVLFGLIVLMLPKAVTYAAGASAEGWPIWLLTIAVSALTSSYLCVLPCAAFMDLQQAKEGKDIQNVANVFD